MLSRLITRREQAILLGLIVAIGLGAGALYYHDRQSAAMQATAPATPPTSAARTTPTAASVPAKAAPVVEPVATTPPVQSMASSGTSESVSNVAVPAPIETAENRLAISVAGAVESPGMYRLKMDARLQDAILAAGGLVEDADTTELNLAARVIDASTLTVPFKSTARTEGNKLVARGRVSAAAINPVEYTIWGSGKKSASTAPATTPDPGSAAVPHGAAASAGKASGPVDLNTASAQELDTLPGIGPKFAQEIIRYRTATPFNSVEDLQNIPRFGTKRIDAIRDLVTVSPSR